MRDSSPVGQRRRSASPLHSHRHRRRASTRYAKDVEKIVREERRSTASIPHYEPGYYTFLADYLPYAGGDGMEHRNSTVITRPRRSRQIASALLDTVAHEFFHCWNVERIRPQGLEPFNFDRANMTDSLWLAEGFTQYYGPLMLQRAGLVDLARRGRRIAGLVDSVVIRARRTMLRSADGDEPHGAVHRRRPRRSIARTGRRPFISYYPFGGAIALALDLTLRDRTDGR